MLVLINVWSDDVYCTLLRGASFFSNLKSRFKVPQIQNPTCRQLFILPACKSQSEIPKKTVDLIVSNKADF